MQYPPTPEQREWIIKKQRSMCLLCGKTKILVIDHDHATGEIRGALCSPCNTGLGMFYDDKHLLNSAKAYLSGYRGVLAPSEREEPEICDGSWQPPVKESDHIYRCSVCDRTTGARRTVKMELIRRGEYLVRHHYKRTYRGKASRLMSAAEGTMG